MDRRGFLALAAGAVLARPSRLLAAPPLLACATCDQDERLAVVDVAAGTIARTIPCLPDPRSIERVGRDDALVCHTNVGAVTIVDGAALAARHVLRDFQEPRYTAAHPDGRHAFVTDSGLRQLVSVDVLAGRTLGRVQLPEWPRHVTVSPSGRTLWVGLGNAYDRVAVVDVSNPARPVHTAGVAAPFLAHDVGFRPDGRRIWVTSGEHGTLGVYRPDGSVAFRLPADAAPQHVTFAGDRVYVTSGDSGALRMLKPDGRVLRTTRIPSGSYNVQAGHGLLLTPSLGSGTLTILDAGARIVHQLPVGRSSHDACFLG